MSTHVVRIWIPDRPGALGAVASRIGSVRGDLIGIDILERGAGLAIDELVVTLPDADLVPLLLKEINEVDGVAVEDIVSVPGDGLPDPRLAALETAAVLVQLVDPGAVLDALVGHAAHDFGAGWACVIDGGAPRSLAAQGEPPPAPWVAAFVAGSRTAPEGAPEDVAWAPLRRAGLDLVLGRPGRPIRARERRQLAALGEIADVRWAELARVSALRAHPTAG
ncbi:MAG TPA: hypothetical protein VM933_04645 [Acidimicrobiales bacterium]|nr:hypothetical protein [Acidimicrobiales bacterium]